MEIRQIRILLGDLVRKLRECWSSYLALRNFTLHTKLNCYGKTISHLSIFSCFGIRWRLEFLHFIAVWRKWSCSEHKFQLLRYSQSPQFIPFHLPCPNLPHTLRVSLIHADHLPITIRTSCLGGKFPILIVNKLFSSKA